MEKSNECTAVVPAFGALEGADDRTQPKTLTYLPDNNLAGIKKMQLQPASWLNVSLDAALGCRANVFQIQKSLTTGKKGGSESRNIAIHSQAVPPICR